MLAIFMVPSYSPRKLMHAMQDDCFKREIHELHGMHKLAEQVYRYDLDYQDVQWLISVNEERDTWGEGLHAALCEIFIIFNF